MRSRAPRILPVVLVGTLVAGAYVAWHPLVPDLTAQLAWAGFVSHAGVAPVFADWYGGLTLGSYSLLVPWLMARFGVVLVGALAAALILLVGATLVARSRHPRAGFAALFVADVADLLCGRVTFAVGSAAALAALWALRERKRGAVVVLAVVATLSSPVAGVVLLVGLAAVAWCDRERRRTAAVAGAAAVGVLLFSAWAFPLKGYEPFHAGLFFVVATMQLACVVVASGRIVKTAALVGLGLIAIAFVVHTALGGDIARLPILLTAPAAVADAAGHRRFAAVAALAACIYPSAQAGNDLANGYAVASTPDFATGLVARLRADPLARTHRVEVVDTSTHWGAVQLSRADIAVARGWLTQADEVDNPLFYGRAPLNARTYRAFLDRTATAYVAVEHGAPLDGGAIAEARLIAAGLPYLRQVWSDQHWTVYAVQHPAPLAVGVATVLRTTPTGVLLDARTAGRVEVDVSYSRYLIVNAGTVARRGSTVQLTLRTPGVHFLQGAWPWHDADSAPAKPLGASSRSVGVRAAIFR